MTEEEAKLKKDECRRETAIRLLVACVSSGDYGVSHDTITAIINMTDDLLNELEMTKTI